MIRNDKDQKSEYVDNGQTAVGPLKKMLEDRESTLTRMRESEFVNIYLPLLHGDLEIPEDEYPMVAWVKVAGTAFNEVIIVDDTTGDELFRVPPMIDAYDPNESDISMYEVMSEAIKLEHAMPEGGLRYLENINREHFVGKHEPAKYYDRMSAIFERYNLEPLAETADVEDNGESSSDIDDLEFD